MKMDGADTYLDLHNDYYILIGTGSVSPNGRVKSGIFGKTAKFGQRPCLFHISNIGIKIN